MDLIHNKEAHKIEYIYVLFQALSVITDKEEVFVNQNQNNKAKSVD